MLRKSSLDELPQLFNILRGEMSCVGPRPIVQDELCRYGSHVGEYLQARPGLTGLWQVSGRSSTDYAERVSLDSHYVRNWSPWLDLVILLRTVIAVMRVDRAS
jgi:exopolysaccharide production protein ExoY